MAVGTRLFNIYLLILLNLPQNLRLRILGNQRKKTFRILVFFLKKIVKIVVILNITSIIIIIKIVIIGIIIINHTMIV
jgi:hypothetical protein